MFWDRWLVKAAILLAFLNKGSSYVPSGDAAFQVLVNRASSSAVRVFWTSRVAKEISRKDVNSAVYPSPIVEHRAIIFSKSPETLVATEEISRKAMEPRIESATSGSTESARVARREAVLAPSVEGCAGALRPEAARAATGKRTWLSRCRIRGPSNVGADARPLAMGEDTERFAALGTGAGPGLRGCGLHAGAARAGLFRQAPAALVAPCLGKLRNLGTASGVILGSSAGAVAGLKSGALEKLKLRLRGRHPLLNMARRLVGLLPLGELHGRLLD